MFYKWILLIVCVCCLINLARGQSGESSSDYENEEDDEFADLKNDKDFKKGKVSGRARDPFMKRDGEDDEFANMEEEFQNDKDFLNMKDDEKSGKDKEDIEFQLAFGEDDSKEKSEKDEFYQAVKEDVDEDFNMYSSNKMNKRVRCDNSDDCEELNDKAQRSEDAEDDSIDLANRTSIDRLVDSDKTTIMYVNSEQSEPTTSRPTGYTERHPPLRQYEEETTLKAEHHLEDDHWNTPLECDCDTKIQPKIIGGSPAAKNAYPFAVAIFTLVGRGSFCGGTIINERYILTAQHCVQRHYRNPRNYNIVAGRTDLNVSDILEDFITKASHIWLNGRSNDVALVRLSQSLDFSNAIKPACFGGPSIVPKDQPVSGYNKFGFDSSHFNNLENVSKHFKKTNRTLRAIGWGYTGWKVTKVNGISKIRPIMTTKLQEVDLNEVICAKEEYLICVEGKGKSPCFGDSGSPLLFDYYDKYVVVGLTSRSSSSKARFCLGAPTIYERSSYYLPWLKTLTSNRICVVD